ncbi:hypothetical protein SCHPADRAFT_227363 [Schizopora paradoxa]|uniref:Zn(2)-C6 fungal-type domain-containing protein n=1 Tax=Schizopora paradoxa TaxID=27342 RepID=A0A0H2RW02_9AGAM|nr:hypothetical protein SCHPADRAFT_227363 [Schizopora paradoxa]
MKYNKSWQHKDLDRLTSHLPLLETSNMDFHMAHAGHGPNGNGNGNHPISNHTIAALNRNYNGCDKCRRDRKKCEGGVPCLRCQRMRRPCTSDGRSQRENLNDLIFQRYGPHCLLARHIYRDGYYAIFSRDGFMYHQNLTNFYEPIGELSCIGPDHVVDVRNVPYNVDFTIEDLLNAGRNGPY